MRDMQRHVVVEGPDGSGKTNLVTDLVTVLGRPVHTRPCTSDGGVIDPDNLDRWVMYDLHQMSMDPQRYIYDRHPVISEPVYGRIIRSELRGCFTMPSWRKQAVDWLSEQAVIVFCLPPWDVVRTNIQATDQMPGVKEFGFQIYNEYQDRARSWPGPWLIHDYTTGQRELTYYRIMEMCDGRTH